MDPSEGFEFEFVGALYEVRPAVLVTGGREIQQWFVLRDGRGLTTIPAVPGEPEEQIRVRVVRWLEDHLFEFTYKGVAYQVVHSEVPEDTRDRLSKLRAIPSFFWIVTSGPEYVTQFPGEPGQSWHDAKQKVIHYVDSPTGSP